MKKDNSFSIVFLPEFLIPSLEELNITMSDFNDAIKNRKVTIGMDVNTDEEYKNTVDKLIKFIGKGDLTELYLMNRYMHDILRLEFYQNNFITFFEEILQGSGSYKNEENSSGLILNTLNSKNVSKNFTVIFLLLVYFITTTSPKLFVGKTTPSYFCMLNNTFFLTLFCLHIKNRL